MTMSLSLHLVVLSHITPALSLSLTLCLFCLLFMSLYFFPSHWIWIVLLCFIWDRFNIPVTLLNLRLNVDLARKPAGIKHLKMTQILSPTPTTWGLTYTQTQTGDYEEFLQGMSSFPNNKGQRKCVTQRWGFFKFVFFCCRTWMNLRKCKGEWSFARVRRLKFVQLISFIKLMSSCWTCCMKYFLVNGGDGIMAIHGDF